METIKHNNYTEINFNVNYHGESYKVRLTDSNDRIEGMLLFINNENHSWFWDCDNRQTKGLRQVLDARNHESFTVL